MNDMLAQLQRLNNYQTQNLLELQVTAFRDQLLKSPGKYEDQRCLNRFESEIFSQCGEDGIIEEIFKRIGVTNRYFIEFGAGNGLQNNTAALLLRNWYGLWMDADPKNADTIRTKFSQLISRRQLTFLQTFITAENIEELFRQAEILEEFDLLSIDIDGNDYWVWQAITHYRPRVVVCEYNARYGSTLKWIMKYNPAHQWNGSCYYGASLAALTQIGASKGYKLVGCNMAGVNSFFVREDLIAHHFAGPHTADSQYEPQRVFLMRTPVQAADFGPFEGC